MAERTLDNYIWFEKHRPKTIKDMVLPVAYRRRFSEYISAQEIPHLLFYGGAGGGKTTMAFILMESIPSTCLTLNASSDDRGIATVKGKIKQFAMSMSMDKKLKIVFLDEADKLTNDAMDALRNTMETYSKNCRFILTCNYVDKISDPIKSRCTAFEFNTYSLNNLKEHVHNILKKEQVKYEAEEIDTIVERHYPDIRSIINCIQAGSMGGTFNGKIINTLTVDPETVLDYIFAGEVGKLRVLLAGITDFTWLYKLMFDALLIETALTDEEKAEVVEVLSEYLYRDSQVINREINFIACCVNLMGAIKCQKISFSL